MDAVPPEKPAPLRILMTVDAVGGVWTYAMELAKALRSSGVSTVFAGFGPPPSEAQRHEAARIGILEWPGLPLDWLASHPGELEAVAPMIETLAERHHCDLLHLNLPSQAWNLRTALPVATVSHSCIATWWQMMRSEPLPEEWRWHVELNAAGMERADAVIVPSRSHGEQLERAYGPLGKLRVVRNARTAGHIVEEKERFILAAGRWWDEGKNGRVLDQAALRINWPLKLAGSPAGPNGQHFTAAHAEMVGALPQQELARQIGRAAVVVSPSLYEPFGLVALEAALAGCALVLSDIPTYRELWSGAALFFDPHDPQALAERIGQFAGDDDFRREMAALAQARSRNFGPGRQAEAMRAIYMQLSPQPVAERIA